MKRLWTLSLACLILLSAPRPAVADISDDMMRAAYHGDRPLVEQLLNDGASPNAVDKEGYTALHWAAKEGHAELVRLFLERGAPMDAPSYKGETALMLAARENQLEVARLLLARGASLEPRSKEGQNALELAVSGGTDELVILMQEASDGVRPPWPAAQVEREPAIPVTGAVLISKDERFRTIGLRIDALPYETAPLQPPAPRPFERWVGEKFMFLPIEREELHEYPSFTYGDEKAGPNVPNASYEHLVGRVGTVVRLGKDGADRFVVMRLDDDGTLVRGTTGVYGDFPELGPALDLYVARKLYTGKILWPRDNAISRFTRQMTGRSSRVRIGPWVPVIVAGVFPGENAANPIRLVLRTATGKEGFVDLAISDTNMPRGDGARRRFRVPDLFYPADPRQSVRWSDQAWRAIREDQVYPGMNADQVRASWGRPDKIEPVKEPAGERWIYEAERTTLHFAAGRVARVAVAPPILR